MLSFAANTLVEDILRGDLSPADADVLFDTSSNGCSNNQLELVILKVIENWSASINNSLDPRFMFALGEKRVNTEKIIKAVEVLKCENEFCQILLLLPEKVKGRLILELCNVLKHGSNLRLQEILLHKASTDYCRNIMVKISVLHESVIQSFFNSVNEIIKCTEDLMLKNFKYIMNFVDNFLGNFEIDGNNGSPAFSLLNKHGGEKVRELLKLCRSRCYGNSIRVMGDSDFHLLMQVDLYSSVLTHLFTMLCKFEKCDMLSDTGEHKELFLRVMLKAKQLYSMLCTNETTCPKTLGLFSSVQVFLEKSCKTFFLDDVIESPHFSVDEALQNNNHLHDKVSSNLLICDWKLEINKDEKFLQSMCCLDNLYFGHEETLSWLLSYGELTSEWEIKTLVNHLTAYTINYGSVSFIKRLMDILYFKRRNDHNDIYHLIQEVVIKALSYLTLKGCNTLISNCKEYFESGQSLLWSSRYIEKQFQSSLNEVFNKLTSSNADNITLTHLSQLCVVSPLKVLQELVDRMFYGTLNHSVLKSVLLSIPAVFDLELVDELDKKISPIPTYIKNSYIKNREKHSSKSIITIISVLLNVVPDAFKSKFYHMVSDFFLFPNLSLNKSQVFVPMNVTLKILETVLQPCYLDIASVSYNVSLCKYLLDIIDNDSKDIAFLDVIDNLNDLLCMLISNMSDKFMNSSLTQQEETLASVRKLLDNYSWSHSFYFYSFFETNGYLYRHAVPESLREFQGDMDDARFNYCQDLVYDLNNSDSEDEQKWIGLFQISFVSHKAAFYLIEHLPVVVADEETCVIAESVAKLLPDKASIYRAKSVIACLTRIVDMQKIDGIASWFSDDLISESKHHGACFSMFAIIQGFQIYYIDMAEEARCQKHTEIQIYMKIFHIFLLYSKDVGDIKVRSSILLYLFELLVFNNVVWGEFITDMLSLLLMDILIAILDCIKSSKEEVTQKLIEQCKNILARDDGKSNTTLREKFNTSLDI